MVHCSECLCSRLAVDLQKGKSVRAIKKPGSFPRPGGFSPRRLQGMPLRTGPGRPAQFLPSLPDPVAGILPVSHSEPGSAGLHGRSHLRVIAARGPASGRSCCTGCPVSDRLPPGPLLPGHPPSGRKPSSNRCRRPG